MLDSMEAAELESLIEDDCFVAGFESSEDMLVVDRCRWEGRDLLEEKAETDLDFDDSSE